MIQKPSLLVSAVNMIEALPITEGDAKGDLYEYLLSKLTTAGINGQFRTPRHIIRFMVEMLEPKPTETDRRPGVRHRRLPRRRDAVPAGEVHVAEGQAEGRERREDLHGRSARAVPRAHPERDVPRLRLRRTMLRIASMNLMLHGVDNPDIHYQDTLSNSFPGEVPEAGDRRLRRHPGQPAVQGEPRRGGRAPDAHAGGEDEEDRAALRGAHPADAEEGRAERDYRAGRRALRIVEGARGAPTSCS